MRVFLCDFVICGIVFLLIFSVLFLRLLDKKIVSEVCYFRNFVCKMRGKNDVCLINLNFFY